MTEVRVSARFSFLKKQIKKSKECPSLPGRRTGKAAQLFLKPSERKSDCANGFTVLETLVVLSLVVFLASLGARRPEPYSLSLFSKELLLQIQKEQFLAFYERKTRKITIHSSSLQTQEKRLEFPAGIACQEQTFTFNARGNISKGGTLICSERNRRIRLVFQLGAGKGKIVYEN